MKEKDEKYTERLAEGLKQQVIYSQNLQKKFEQIDAMNDSLLGKNIKLQHELDELIPELRKAQARIRELEQEIDKQWIKVSDDIPSEGNLVFLRWAHDEKSIGYWYEEDVEHDEHERYPDVYKQWECWNYGENKFQYCECPLEWMRIK